MLVPTTILAQQHLGTFRERLRDSPYEIEMVSRLRKPAEVREALARFADGRVDILIGTHRLLSRDVRAKDLGLVIVDEEQRFGVKQKELLRQLKLKVDVLSLSATPIPRTLQMSLAGLRDISVIETPPEGRRPVRTYVGPYDEELVARGDPARGRAARGRSSSSTTGSRRCTRPPSACGPSCPGVRFAEAHGQMDEGELESTMLALPARRRRRPRRDDDHRVGPRHPAGEHADRRARRPPRARAGLPDPRPGRALRRARLRLHALPVRGGAVEPTPAPRLATLSDHTELGSGFAIAMRDLELRGAGDLLGDEQSGHVAAIGFELYVALLDEAVEAAARRRAASGPRRRSSASTSTSTPTCRPTTSRSRRRRSTSTGGSPAPARPGSCAPCATSFATASARSRSRSRTCSRSSGRGSSSGRRGRAPPEVRGGRISIVPLELDASAVGRLRERIPEAIFELRTRTLLAAGGGRSRRAPRGAARAHRGAHRRRGAGAGRRLIAEPPFRALPLCCRTRESAG